MFRLTLSKPKLKQTAKHEKEVLKIKAKSLFKNQNGRRRKKLCNLLSVGLFFELLMSYRSQRVQEDIKIN